MCTPRRRRSLGARARDHPILILEVRVVGVVQYRWENARQVERAAHLTRLAAREVLTEVKPKHTRARKHPRGAVCRTLLSSLRIVFAARPSFGPSSCVLSDASVPLGHAQARARCSAAAARSTGVLRSRAQTIGGHRASAWRFHLPNAAGRCKKPRLNRPRIARTRQRPAPVRRGASSPSIHSPAT